MLTKLLISWYLKNKRELPWRNTTDAYLIWLSEIILQQTRVNQGLPYYLKFKERYPTVFHLANAPEDEVLRMWQGLGYYSRGRNLLFTAKQVVKEYSGEFPKNIKELKKLKGIGDYTAAAIASIAFGTPEPAIDGNVIRVISRLYKIEDPVDETATLKQIKYISNQLISKEHPAIYNQAMMELGAMVCTPKSPKCNLCPIRQYCQSYKNKDFLRIPIKSKKVKVLSLDIHYLVFINDEKEVFMKQRKENDIWKKMYDFPEIRKSEVKAFLNQFSESEIQAYPTLITQLTHRKVKVNFIKIKVSDHRIIDFNGTWYNLQEIEDLPKPKIIFEFINQLNSFPSLES